MRETRSTTLAITRLICILAIATSPAIAESQPAADGANLPAPTSGWRLEIWATLGTSSGAASGTLVSRYTPQLEYSTSGGTAGQTLVLGGESGAAATLGVDFWPTRNGGLQFLADWSKSDIRGTSSPYDVMLEYEARQPPDYEPKAYVWERSTAWPDPVGETSTLTLALNAVGRWPLGRRLAGALSGGIASSRVSGDLDSVGFTSFKLGGHSVLFPEEYEIGTTMGTTWVTGFDLGASLEIELGSQVALVVGYRYFDGGEAEVPVRVREILNTDQVISPIPLDEIERQLSIPDARIDAGGSRFHAGLKIRLH